MELKKSPKANIERYRGIFFQIGLIITLGIVLAAFEWSTKDESFNGEIITGSYDDDIIELPPVTNPEQHRAPIPPPMPSVFNPLPEYKDFGEPEIDMPDPEDWKGIADKPSIGPINVITPPDEVYDEPMVDLQAQFMGGGTDKFHKWVAERTKYPILAEQNGIEGKVIVKFVINKNGDLTKIDILRSADPSFEEEVIRVLRTSPQWKPAIRKNKPVSVSYIIPVNFSFTK